MTNYTREELTELVQENIDPQTIPAEVLAGVYLENFYTVKAGDNSLELFFDWCRDREDNGQFYVDEFDTVAEFAERIWLETAEEDKQEVLEELAPFIDWQRVWKSSLRHDWIFYRDPDTGESYALSSF